MNAVDDEVGRFYRSLTHRRYLRTHLWEMIRAWAFFNAAYQDEFTGEMPDQWEDLLLLQGGQWAPWYAQLDEGLSTDWLRGFHTHHASYNNKSWEKRSELIVITAGLHQDLHKHESLKGQVNHFALHKRSWLDQVDLDTGQPLGETRIPGALRRKAFEFDAVAVQLETQHRRGLYEYIEDQQWNG